MKVEKTDKYSISVEKVVSETKQVSYTRAYLVKQRKTIEDQKKRDNLARDAELAEIDDLLAECDKLEIETNPEEAERGDAV